MVSPISKMEKEGVVKKTKNKEDGKVYITLHAEGSLAAQKLSIYTLADFERYKAAAKRAARIKDGTKHPIFSQLPEFPTEI